MTVNSTDGQTPQDAQSKTPWLWFWGLVAAGFALDQITKLVVFAAVDLPHPNAIGPTVIPGFFFLTPRENPGMAWSMFAGLGRAMPAVLALMNACIVTAIIAWREKYAVVRRGRRLFDIAMGMVLSGALGNLLDRVHPPFRVMDFLHFRFGTWDYPIFNVADIYIVLGVGVFMYWGWFVEKPEEDENAST